MTRCTTITPRGTRYYLDGRRVSREAFEAAAFWRVRECFNTINRGQVTRHFSEVR